MKRRELLQWLALSAAGSFIPYRFSWAEKKDLIQRKIPSSGELLPVIGMGTWITFNVGNNQELRDARTRVLKTFFELGGRVIDSSPMYGSSEEVLGYALKKLGHPKALFAATKVWTPSTEEGLKQVQKSKDLWGIKKIDLEQVHNLVNWEAHLKNLYSLKERGEIRYLGITTSHGRRHDELEKIMRKQKLDFVQLTYNIKNREADEKLLGLAQERGIAVIANRPYGGGALIKGLKQKPFPEWAKEIGCNNWPEYLLKFIISHPALTCAIPATTKVEHMRENMGACRGILPGQKDRKKMIEYLAGL